MSSSGIIIELKRQMFKSSWIEPFPPPRGLIGFQIVESLISSPTSDHLPILIEVGQQKKPAQGRKKRQHRFEEKWLTDPECEYMVRSLWDQDTAQGSPMYHLTE